MGPTTWKKPMEGGVYSQVQVRGLPIEIQAKHMANDIYKPKVLTIKRRFASMEKWMW